MSRQGQESGVDADRVRVLDVGPLLVHHAHLQEEVKRAPKRCGVCREGMEAVLIPLEKAGVRPLLVPDSGDDEDGAAPLPPGDGKVGADEPDGSVESRLERLERGDW